MLRRWCEEARIPQEGKKKNFNKEQKGKGEENF